MLRDLASVRGAIHDVARLKEMDLGPCYIIAVSETTLNIIQNYAIDEIAFLSRYGVEFGGGYYTPIDDNHPDFDFVLDTIRRYRLEVNDLTCDLIAAIDNLTIAVNAIAECCGEASGGSSQDVDSPPNSGEISVGGPGDQFADQASYFDAKCNVANAIYDTILGFVSDIDVDDVETIISGIAGGATAVLASRVNASGPLGWAISKVATSIVQLAFIFISSIVDFDDIAAALDEQHEEIVEALFGASSAGVARGLFMAALGDAATSLTAIETELVSTLLTSEMLNNLFDPRPDAASYTSPDPIDCGTTLAIWTFDTGAQGWTFVDQSHGSLVTSGVWVSAAEAWRITLDMSSGTGNFAKGAIYIDGLSIAVGVGNSVQLDFSETSDGLASVERILVTFSDASESEFVGPNATEAGVIILDITEAKTISEIAVSAAREYSPTYNYTIDLEEVRVQ